MTQNTAGTAPVWVILSLQVAYVCRLKGVKSRQDMNIHEGFALHMLHAYKKLSYITYSIHARSLTDHVQTGLPVVSIQVPMCLEALVHVLLEPGLLVLL